MCGIAGIIYRDGDHPVGADMTRMLQSMKHRGPDSTGYALFGPASEAYLMRVMLANGSSNGDVEATERLERNRREVEHRLQVLGARSQRDREPHDVIPRPSLRRRPQDAATASRHPRREVLSLGHSLEISRTSATPRRSRRYKLALRGTHAIGTSGWRPESDVDISGAHPTGRIRSPTSPVVHNGQLPNYHEWKRRLERSGTVLQSECDSEIIAVLPRRADVRGATSRTRCVQSSRSSDGVLPYICVTKDELGMAKDELAAKPLVLYESDDIVAVASEEIALRAVLDREIETYDPYESEVMVWHR
jgi:glutamine phosphoribosylpyrophosphate amidotransferase